MLLFKRILGEKKVYLWVKKIPLAYLLSYQDALYVHVLIL